MSPVRSTPVYASTPLSMDGLDELSILLVEDNDADAELIVRALRKGRLVNLVHRVRDGIEALDFLSRSGPFQDHHADLPSLIFLDLHMPRMDGQEFLRRLKLDERTKQIPVVMFASSTEELDLSESYRQGADSYIVKPPNRDAFAEAVSDTALYWLVMRRNKA
jgi:two-component system response regulator